jgi:hypothetical protein
MYNIKNNLRKSILESIYTMEDLINKRLIKFCEENDEGDWLKIKQYFIDFIDEELPNQDNTEKHYRVIDQYLRDNGY